jgi:hypothetical protein
MRRPRDFKPKTAIATIMAWTDLSPQKWQADGKHAFSLCRQNQRKCLIISGAPEEIRTPSLLIRSQMLYPVELRAPEKSS